MRRIAAFTIAALLAGTTAVQAQSLVARPDATAVGVGVICNTSKQADQFVSLRARGTRPEAAMQKINRAAGDPRACGLAAIAFTRDHTVHIRKMGNRLVQVVQINVFAGYNGNNWQPVSGLMTQYAVMDGGGESI